jgi:hypothetical protein
MHIKLPKQPEEMTTEELEDLIYNHMAGFIKDIPYSQILEYSREWMNRAQELYVEKEYEA